MANDDLRLTEVPSVKVGMLIRRPANVVFEALVDPAITTRIWFTKSSGRLTPGAVVTWEWEMYGASAQVIVGQIEENRRIGFRWGSGDGPSTAVEFRLRPWRNNTTYVEVTESGFRGDGDQLVQAIAGSTGGFSFFLSALKALLEHGVALSLVADHQPAGLEL